MPNMQARSPKYYRFLQLVIGSVAFCPYEFAWGYIDPNSGSFLYQLLFPIVTALAAGLVFLRENLFRWIKSILLSIQNMISSKRE
jgi:hypothetical protein